MTAFNDQLKADLEETFFNPMEFAEPVIYKPASGSEYTINGIFDKAFQSVDPNTEQPVISVQPNILLNENDLQAAVKTTDKIKIRNVLYEIIDVQPDGVGTTRLILHEKI